MGLGILQVIIRGAFTTQQHRIQILKGFHGGVFDGRYVYLVPIANSIGYHGQVSRYDTTDSFTNQSSWSFYDTAAQNPNSKRFGGAVFDSRYIYFVPYGDPSGQVTRYDTNGQFTNQSSWSFYDTASQNPNSKGFAGGVFDGRYIYLVPAFWGAVSPGQVTRYDTTGDNASYSILYGLGQNSFGSTPFGFGMRINTNKGIYSVFDNRNQTLDWHHIAGTYNGTSLSLYVDGNRTTTVNASGSITINSAPLSIGSVLNSYFNGTIDEVRIYDRALSAEKISDLYYNYTITNYPGSVKEYAFQDLTVEEKPSFDPALDNYAETGAE